MKAVVEWLQICYAFKLACPLVVSHAVWVTLPITTCHVFEVTLPIVVIPCHGAHEPCMVCEPHPLQMHLVKIGVRG